MNETHAFVTDRGGGLRVIDVADPSAPVEVGFWSTTSNAYDVSVSGNHAYVANQWDGLPVINISQPDSPAAVGHYDTQGMAAGVFTDDNLVFVADGGNGLVILRLAALSPVGCWTTFTGRYQVYRLLRRGGYSTSTDVTGAYGLVDLPAGSYTIPPSLNGYDFMPESIQITLPPSAANQSFLGEALLRSIFLPAVLQPGV